MHLRSRKTHRLFRTLFVGLALCTAVVVASLIAEGAATDVRVKLDNALRLERDLGRLLTTMQDAQTGQRGYLLTGNEAYLDPYRRALDTLPPVLARIGSEVMTDSLQQLRVARVRQLTGEKFAELSETIVLKSAGDEVALDRLVNSDLGEELMTDIRNVIDTLRDVELSDVRVRQREASGLRTFNSLLRWLGLLGLVFVIFYTYGLIQPLFTKLSDTNAALELKNRELDNFAHIASHDLREPLRTVSSYVEVIDEDYGDLLDGDGKALLATIHRATDRMRRLIDGLLLYSRGGRTGTPGPVDLTACVHQAIESLRVAIEESNASITVGELPQIIGYRLGLSQLFQNLLANAIKFRRPARVPEVMVSATETTAAVTVWVKDNGIGMNPADRRRIFGLFTRLNGDDTYEGQGIGLAFCQKIVQLHGGTISVESELGLGSTFIITLPLAMPDEPPEAHPHS